MAEDVGLPLTDRKSQSTSPNSSDDELSFVLTELDHDIGEMAADFNPMTQSKYAQVVFHEIADNYPNDCDLACRFSFNLGIQGVSKETDRIGIYRVPAVVTCDYIAFQWVKSGNDSVVFNAVDLPKDEDFYQFQYLRTDNGNETVLGASIPFQLRAPKMEELCTVEDDEEFMVVKSKTAIISEKMTGQIDTLCADNLSMKKRVVDLESNHARLLDISEKLESNLREKTDQLLAVKSSQNDSIKLLKADLARVLEDKLELEEKIHQHAKVFKALQTERDLLTGERDQAIREKNLLSEERNQFVSKSDDMKNMLIAVTKSKELAVDELKACMLNVNEGQKIIEGLNSHVKDLMARNSSLEAKIGQMSAKSTEDDRYSKDLLARNKSLKTEMDQASRKSADTIRLQTERFHMCRMERDDFEEKLSRKEEECRLLSEEIVATSRAKFQEIQELKKQLANLTETMNNNDSVPFSIDVDNQVSTNQIVRRLESLERTVHETQAEMRALSTHVSSTTGSNCGETDIFPEPSVSSISSNDSRLLLDDSIIQRHIVNSANVASPKIDPTSGAIPKRSLIEGYDPTFETEQKSEEIVEKPVDKEEKSCSVTNGPPKTLTEAASGPETLEPAKAPEKHEPVKRREASEDEEMLSALVSCLASNDEVESFVLTDDGRTVNSTKGLSCFICHEKFDTDNLIELRRHVDEHLAGLRCPVCDLTFDMESRKDYQTHVQGHFDEEDGISGDWFSPFFPIINLD